MCRLPKFMNKGTIVAIDKGTMVAPFNTCSSRLPWSRVLQGRGSWQADALSFLPPSRNARAGNHGHSPHILAATMDGQSL